MSQWTGLPGVAPTGVRGIVKERSCSRAGRELARDTNPLAPWNGCRGRECRAQEKSDGAENFSNQFVPKWNGNCAGPPGPRRSHAGLSPALPPKILGVVRRGWGRALTRKSAKVDFSATCRVRSLERGMRPFRRQNKKPCGNEVAPAKSEITSAAKAEGLSELGLHR
jgi:hypothetical protein